MYDSNKDIEVDTTPKKNKKKHDPQYTRFMLQ